MAGSGSAAPAATAARASSPAATTHTTLLGLTRTVTLPAPFGKPTPAGDAILLATARVEEADRGSVEAGALSFAARGLLFSRVFWFHAPHGVTRCGHSGGKPRAKVW